MGVQITSQSYYVLSKIKYEISLECFQFFIWDMSFGCFFSAESIVTLGIEDKHSSLVDGNIPSMLLRVFDCHLIQ
jgi:hypothetical protein